MEYVVDGDQARALPLYGRSSGLLAYFSGVCDLWMKSVLDLDLRDMQK